jgi:hypothetical protein
MPNFKMAQPGHSFSEDGIDLSWGIGREASDVISLTPAQQSARFKQRVLAGVIVETDDPVTTSGGGDVREYRLLTGDEARAHKAIPAGPVTRSVYNPVTGGVEDVEIGSTVIVPEPVPAAPGEPDEVDAEPETESEAESEDLDELDAEPQDPAEAEK